MVDDDADDRHLAKFAFNRLNTSHSLEFLTGGQELIDYLKSVAKFPDLILLDLNMPGKNGFETLTEIKSNPVLKNLKVIIFSTSNSENDIAQAKKCGAENYFIKPSDLNKLIEIFRKIVS